MDFILVESDIPRSFDPHKITYQRLLELMRDGAEPINRSGEGWSVEVYDHREMKSVRLPIEEAVIRQVKVFGIAETTKESNNLVLRMKMSNEHSPY